jgi:hypothetical protein
VVSHVFYVTEMEKNHVHHAYYQSLPDFDARLKTSILGLPPFDYAKPGSAQGFSQQVEFPDIAKRFEPYLGWLDRPEVLTLHFEELVNNRAVALHRIIDHFLLRVPLKTPLETMLPALEDSINPGKSPTFRSGKTGEWKKYFKDEHKAIFKEVAGDLLVRLGYEADGNW